MADRVSRSSFARAVGAKAGRTSICAGASRRAALAEPKDLIWLLAPYARDGIAQAEAAGHAPSLMLGALRARKWVSTGCRD